MPRGRCAHLEVGHDHVQVVVGLGSRRERLGWSPAHRGARPGCRRDRGSLAQQRRRALDQDRGPGLHQLFTVDCRDATAHALRHPIVVVWPQQVQVARHHGLGDRAQLGGRQAGIDAQVAQGAVEPVHMLDQPEGPMGEGSGGVEHCVAVEEASVAKRQQRDFRADTRHCSTICARCSAPHVTVPSSLLGRHGDLAPDPRNRL